MTTIHFNYKDFLGQELENAICKVVPQQPSLSGGEVRLNSPIFVSDGDLLVLPIGIYTVTISGSYLKVVGYFEITSTTPDPTFISSILSIVTDASNIPSGTPISAIQGLQAELDSKLPINDPRLNNLLTNSERAKLAGIQNGATSNQTDTFLLTRTNHIGEQPISSITGLETRLVGVESRNEFTNAERTKLTGIANNATQNATDAFLVNRANHTGSQPESSITGLSTRLGGIDTSITSLTARNEFTTAERTKLNGIANGATQNSTDTFLLARGNHTGTQAQSTITNLTTDLGNINSSITSLTARNIFTTDEQTKLAGIQTGATLNSPDTTLLNRANHTGTQGINTVSGLQAALDSRLVVTGTPTVNQVPIFNGTVVAWGNQTGSGGTSGVSSFNARTGNVVPDVSDYSSFFIQPNSSPTLNNITATGSIQVSCAGSSEASPRVLGLSNLNSGTAARLQFGDSVNAIQTRHGGRLQLLGWHGIEFYGAHSGSTPGFNQGFGNADFNVNIIATYPTHKLLSLRGLSNQTGNILEVRRGGDLVQSITPDGLTRLDRVFTNANLPSASSNQGALAYRSDGNSRLVFSNGSGWQDIPDSAFVTDRANHTGTQAQSTITNLVSDLGTINTNISSLTARNEFTNTERAKLTGIQNGATQNSTDTFLLNRANHTGSQPISTITNLQSALNTKLEVSGTPNTNQVPIFNGTSVVWGDQTGAGGTAGVSSFNGRSGVVVPQLSDYSSFFIQPNTTPSLTGLNSSGNITLQNSGSNNQPVSISTYAFSGGEQGISVPQLRVSGGRMDFTPLDNKCEMRITGTNTEFNIYNTSTNSFVMRVNSSGDNSITRDLTIGRNVNASGNISANGFIASNQIYTNIDTTLGIDGNGRLKLTDIPDAAVAVNSGGGSNWITVPRTSWVEDRANRSNFNYVGSTVPSNPNNGQTWREITTNSYFDWYWDSTLSLWVSMNRANTNPQMGTNVVATGTATFTVQEQGTGLLLERVFSRARISNNNASNHYIGRLQLLNLANTTSAVTSDVSTSTLASGVDLLLEFPITQQLIPFNSMIALRYSFTRVGTPSMTYNFSCWARYYR